MKRSLFLSAACSIALVACQTGGSDTIKIGMIGPLTGDMAAYGQDILHGAEMAVEEINAAGGINGKMIELIAEDGKCSGGDSASAAQKLVNVDKVIAILGGQCSGETLAAAPIAEAGKVVLLSSFSSNPAVTQAGEYVFRNYPSDALKTKAMANYFAKNGITKIAIITENNDFAAGFRDSLLKDIPAGTAVFNEAVEPGTKDFRTLVTRLKAADFQMFVPNAGTAAVMAELIKQVREAGITQPMISHDVADAANVISVVGDLGTDIFVINVPNVGDGTPFEQKFVAKHGEPSSAISSGAFVYDDVMLLAQGLKTAKTSTELRDWLDALPSYTGIIGTFGFDENGDVTGVPYALKKYDNGTIQKIADIAVD